jgi:hypothetical protein
VIVHDRPAHTSRLPRAKRYDLFVRNVVVQGNTASSISFHDLVPIFRFPTSATRLPSTSSAGRYTTCNVRYLGSG